ncbi:MAG: HTH domain-containing protein, partial [Thiohalophilus sp.]
MDRTERFYKIDKLLRTSRRGVPAQRFLDELAVSRATFHRDIDYLRDRFNAPIL